MRILQICNKAPYPANDGSSIAIYNMSLGFIENEADLYLLTINTKKHFKPDKLVPEEFKRRSKYVSVYKNTNVNPAGLILNLLSKESYFLSRFYFRAFKNKLIEVLKKNTFDIIHLEGLFVATYIPVIRKYSKAKIAIRAHNIEHLIWDRMIANETNAVKKKYLVLQNERLKKFELSVLPRVDAIVTITDYDKQYLEKLGIKNNYFVSPTGIDVSKYPLQADAEERCSVFHFGSMDWMPNVEAVEWFLEHVWLKHFIDKTNYTFYIAGRNMPAKLLNINYNNVKIVPDVKDSVHFYNSKEIMVVPLLSGSGMRIKILEGMAMSKAIVSTAIGAEGIPVTQNKNIILANTAEGFALAIKNIAENNDLKVHLKENARIFITESFNNKKLVKDLLLFYSNLLN